MLVSSATKAPHMEKKMDLYLTSFNHNKSFVLIEKEDQLYVSDTGKITTVSNFTAPQYFRNNSLKLSFSSVWLALFV